MFLDPAGRWLRDVPLPASFPTFRTVNAAGDGFVVRWETQPTADSPRNLHLQFVNRAGMITGTSVVTISRDSFGAVSVVPHPLGVALFWRERKQLAATIVRTDGTILAAATYPTPDLEVSRVTAAYKGGQFAIGFDTYIQSGGPPDTFIPPMFASYVMRVSDSLAVQEGPVRLAPGAATSSVDALAASGDAFFANWDDGGEHIQRIPLNGSIDPKVSVPFNIVPPGRPRTVSH